MRNRLAIVFSLCTALLFLSTHTTAQNGLWPTSDAEWHVQRVMAHGIIIPDSNPNQINIINGALTTELEYFLGGPTKVDGEAWIELWQRWESTFQSHDGDTTVHYPPGMNYRGALREVGSQVFFYDPAFGTPELLYDFDLAVGDTLASSYIHHNNNAVVTSIDSIMLDGTPHRRYHLAVSGFTGDFIVEGMGSNHGPINSLGIGFDINHSLECFGRSAQTLYPANSSGCTTITGVEEHVGQRTEYALLVAPNPSAHGSYISLQKDAVAFHSLTVFNMQGQQVQQRTGLAWDGTTVYLNTEELPAGSYLLLAQDIDGTQHRARLIVAR